MDTASLLVDEARDVSIKEQMAVVLHYVDTNGCIIEQFLDISHVLDTSARSLKASIELMFAKNGLSLTRVRGQGYDGASNMRGQFNGLKSLILEDNKSAFYVHCFTHQLQLALVACVKKVQPLKYFFDHLTLLCTVVDTSSKREDLLRVKRAKEVIESLASGELETGQGLNQEITLKRVGDTRWGSHYGTIVSLILLFNPTLEVLEAISEDGPSEKKRTEAAGFMKNMQKFKFAFLLQLMSKVLEITNELSQALQKKDQDIVNTMILVETSKTMLQELRDNGWDHLFKKT